MTRRPRILILSTAYLPLIGGSELAVKHLTDRLTEYDFDLVTWQFSRAVPMHETIGRVAVYRVGGLKLFLPFAILRTAWRLMHLHGYVLVHAYQASYAGIAGMLLRMWFRKVPFILTLQEGKNLARQSWFVRFPRTLIIRTADRVTAISTFLADYAKGSGAKKVDIIPNGVDIGENIHVAHNPDPTVITISRLVPKNNVQAIIRARDSEIVKTEKTPDESDKDAGAK